MDLKEWFGQYGEPSNVLPAKPTKPVDAHEELRRISDLLDADNDWACWQKACDQVGVGSMCGMINMTNAQFLQVVIIDNELLLGAGMKSRFSKEQYRLFKRRALDDPRGRIVPERKQGLA